VIKADGDLKEWEGAFVTPVHVGHPDFLNRGAQFYYLWDESFLYIGLKCLDQTPAHVAPDNQIFNGDAVEFYLDTRRGNNLGAVPFGPGTLHMFWTPFSGKLFKPRLQVRDLPAFKDFKLRGADVAGQKTPSGYAAEFKLSWLNFPDFKPMACDVIGIDCELCSSDGGLRVDRTFVYSSPRSVSTPASFGRVQLVDKLTTENLRMYGKVLLPLSLNQSANYPWLYGTAGVSPSIAALTKKIEGKVLNSTGKAIKSTIGKLDNVADSGITVWRGSWELFDVAPGTYTVEVTAHDASGKALTSHKQSFLHGNPRP
jgi:hypothetical protein